MPKDTDENARSSTSIEIEKIDRAIEAQENLRGVIADEEVEATLRSLRERRAALMAEGSSPESSAFMRFRAEGFGMLPLLEASGASMLETLCGPMNVHKWVTLGALNLFLSALALNLDPNGPPLLVLVGFDLEPWQARAFGGNRVILSADVAISPKDIAASGQKPNVLSLDKLGVTFLIERDDDAGALQIKRFEVGSRDFARGARSVPEIQDLHLAARLLVHATFELLKSTRLPRSTGGSPKPNLDERDRRTLDIVASYAFDHESTPRNEVLLNVPKGDAELGEAEASLDTLTSDGYLSHLGDAFAPTLKGLMACSRGDEAVGLALRLLDYVTFRADTERARFTSYSVDELLAANIVSGQAYFTHFVISLFRLGEGNGIVWAVPSDIVDLRRIGDIHGLLARCERLRQPVKARAAKEVNPRKAKATKRTSVTAGGRSVVGGTMRENIIVTGDNNTVVVNPGGEDASGRALNAEANGAKGLTPLDALLRLLPGQLDVVMSALRVPTAMLSGPQAPLATRATELLRWVEQQQRMADLVAELKKLGP